MTDTSTPESSVSAAPPTEADASSETAEETKKSETVTSDSDLFRQSEIAADYVEGLLDILDYDGDIDELVSGGRPMVEVVGGRLNSLVGTRGATLEALQELTRLAIFRATGSPSRLLLDILDYDGDIDELVSAGRPMVEVVGGRLQPLVGQRGATLEALQELTRLAIYRQTGSPSRLLLDVGGYRANRRKELAAVAKNAVEKVKEHGDPVRLEAMSAFERKCVHDVINALAGVESESEGVEPSRRIVVRPVG